MIIAIKMVAMAAMVAKLIVVVTVVVIVLTTQRDRRSETMMTREWRKMFPDSQKWKTFCAYFKLLKLILFDQNICSYPVNTSGI